MGRTAPAGGAERLDRFARASTTETVETKDPDGRVVRREITKPVVQRVPVALDQTRAEAVLDLEHRRKGLLWYPTYTVAFKAAYRFTNPDGEARTVASGSLCPPNTRSSTTSCSR